MGFAEYLSHNTQFALNVLFVYLIKIVIIIIIEPVDIFKKVSNDQDRKMPFFIIDVSTTL